jgi:hypothetical protein
VTRLVAGHAFSIDTDASTESKPFKFPRLKQVVDLRLTTAEQFADFFHQQDIAPALSLVERGRDGTLIRRHRELNPSTCVSLKANGNDK